jgi:L-ascorbate metabolism protein UlaG (beta-lactamase superfamily)
VDDELALGSLTVVRTPARHGYGADAEALAPVSGFVLSAPGEPTLYVAGDTVWCEEVAAALDEHRPDVVIVNAGAARFLDSGLITMGSGDVAQVADAAPGAQVVAVHLEAINHCLLSREELAAAVAGRRVAIPADGETLTL